MPNFRMTTAKRLIEQALALDYFQPNAAGVVAIPARYTPGKGKLIVAVGDNASGKSLFRRIVQTICARTSTECIHLSMEGRRGVAYAPWTSLVYGSEEWQSTGSNSASTVLGAITTSLGREHKHVIVWDEPDIGLSDSWAASVGAEIRAFAEKAPEHLVAAVVVTHNRGLLKELVPLDAHFLYFGTDGVGSLPEWIERPPHVRPLSELREDSYKRFKLIQAIQDEIKKKR